MMDNNQGDLFGQESRAWTQEKYHQDNHDWIMANKAIKGMDVIRPHADLWSGRLDSPIGVLDGSLRYWGGYASNEEIYKQNACLLSLEMKGPQASPSGYHASMIHYNGDLNRDMIVSGVKRYIEDHVDGLHQEEGFGDLIEDDEESLDEQDAVDEQLDEPNSTVIVPTPTKSIFDSFQSYFNGIGYQQMVSDDGLALPIYKVGESMTHVDLAFQSSPDGFAIIRAEKDSLSVDDLPEDAFPSKQWFANPENFEVVKTGNLQEITGFIEAKTLPYQMYPIKDSAGAETFIRSLYQENKLFHFDDGPFDQQNMKGEPTFNEFEATLVDERVSEMFKVPGYDPFKLALELVTNPPKTMDGPEW